MRFRAFVFAVAATISAASWAGSVRAASCTNDIDCTTGGTACGSDVCDWTKMPMQTCKAATDSPGWCTVDTDCKCASLGAKCNTASFACTFVLPPDAGASGSSSDGGGGSNSGSSSSGGGSSSGAGSSSGGAGSSSGTASSSSSGSGGCALGGSGGASSWGFAAMAAAVGIVLARRRPRR